MTDPICSLLGNVAAGDDKSIEEVRQRSRDLIARRQAAAEAERRQISLENAFSPIRNFGFYRGDEADPWRESINELRTLLLRLNDHLSAEGFSDWQQSVRPQSEFEKRVMDLLGEEHPLASARLLAVLEAAHPNLNDEPVILEILRFIRGLHRHFMPGFVHRHGDSPYVGISGDANPSFSFKADRWSEEPVSLSDLVDWLAWVQTDGLPWLESGLSKSPAGRHTLQPGEWCKEYLDLIKRHMRRLAGELDLPVLPMVVETCGEMSDLLDYARQWCAEAITAESEATTIKLSKSNPFPSEKSRGTTLPKLLTVWYHGEQSYSAENHLPAAVSAEEHGILQAFLESGAALTTKALEKKVTNVARVARQVAEKFPGAVRMPRKKGDGYYVCVRMVARE